MLATARLVRLVRADTITETVRERVVAAAYAGRDLPDVSADLTWQDTAAMDPNAPLVADLLRCSWCLAVWCAGLVVVARAVAPRVWDPIARVLALSYVAAVVEMTADRA